MNKTRIQNLLSLILCLALIAAIALTVIGCNTANQPETPETQGQTSAETTALTVKGEGATVFYFNLVDKDGVETKFEIHTDKTTVGEALQELGLIEGEVGDYGLYVKKVNGITADYDVDQSYWAFYINGEYAMTGVDSTEIAEGAVYKLEYTK